MITNEGFAGQFARRSLARVSDGIRRLRQLGFGGVPADLVPHRDYFSISIYAGDSPLELAPAVGARVPVLTRHDVTDVVASYVADPFMIRTADGWAMFFEILRKDDAKGVIGLATSRDGLSWEYRQVVLEEAFHLSYPCVFESGGDHYMIPESQQAGCVRLYKAECFPTRWSFVGNLLENVEFVDCTPFQHGGRWWLFAGCGCLPLRADRLRLFHAENLIGPWCEHPASPVVTYDPHHARPAGRVIHWGQRLFRFTQDCSPRYGLSVHAFEITALNEHGYREQPAAAGPVLKASQHGWNAAGMHHMDCHPATGGGCIACVDGWYWGMVD